MSEYRRILYTTVSPVIGALVVIFNLLELFTIYKLNRKSQRTTLYVIYLSSLSASDFTAGLIMIILKSMDPFMKTTLNHDTVAKEIYGILRHVFVRFSLFNSIFNLMALTFDRFIAIKKPLHHKKMNERFAVKVCVLNWVLSLVFVTLMYCISRFYLNDIDRYVNLTKVFCLDY